MKKFTAILCIFCVAIFSSCTSSQNPSNSPDNSGILPSSQVTGSPTITATPPVETTVTTPSAEKQGSILSEFGFDDWGMLGIRLGDSIDTVISVLGEPEHQETSFSPSLEEDVTTCFYDFGKVALLSYGVDEICVDNPGYPACRGIQVGDDIQSVLDKFPGAVTGEPDISGRNYIYGDADSRNKAFLSIDIIGNGNIITATFLCGVRDGVTVSPVALRLDIENDYVTAIRIFVVSV